MLTLAVLLLIAAIFFGALAALFWGALDVHPMPSQSGYIPPMIFCICASPICLLLAFISWLVAVLT